jgi:hypothetical protein
VEELVCARGVIVTSEARRQRLQRRSCAARSSKGSGRSHG